MVSRAACRAVVKPARSGSVPGRSRRRGPSRGGWPGRGRAGPRFPGPGRRVLRAQDAAVEQGVAEREVGDLVFPALVVQADQRGCGVAAVIEQGGGEPVPGGEPGPVGEGDGDPGVDDPDGQAADPGQVGAVVQQCRHGQQCRHPEPPRKALRSLTSLIKRGGKRGFSCSRARVAVPPSEPRDQTADQRRA